MSARAELILGLRGNLVDGLQKAGQQFQRTANIGQRSMAVLTRSSQLASRGLDALGNKYAGLATGAAVAGASRFVVSHERRLTRLGNTADVSAGQLEQLNRRIYETAQQPDIRADPSEILAAMESILEKTGDLEFAENNIRNIGLAIQGSGASGQAIGELMGEFQKLGTVDPAGVMELLDTLNVQGKAGAFTLQNLATLGPRVVTAYAGNVKGLRDNATVVREMGAALQAIRMGTGSSEQAATAFERLLGELQDAQKQKLFRKLGIQLHELGADGTKGLRPVNELLLELFEKTKGDRTLLGGIFGDEAIRSFGDKGLKRIEEFMSVQGDGTQTMQDSARAARDAAAALQSLSTSYKSFADTNLTPVIRDLADGLNAIGPGTVERWLKTATQIAVVVGGVLALRKALQMARGLAGLIGGGGAGGIAGAAGGVFGGMPLPLPVYVVNKQLSMLPGTIGTAGGGAAGGAAAGAGAAMTAKALAKKAGLVGLAGVAGAGVGTVAYKYGLEGTAGADVIGAGIARALALFGNQEAQESIDRMRNSARAEAELQGTLRIQLDQQGRARVQSVETNQPGLEVDVYSGRAGGMQ